MIKNFLTIVWRFIIENDCQNYELFTFGKNTFLININYNNIFNFTNFNGKINFKNIIFK